MSMIRVTPAVSLVDGQAVTTSQNIAEVFGKSHDDVLRRIRTLKCSDDFNARNFAAAEYIDAKGEVRPSFRITRDGCAFLVMGFTGRRAAAFKEAYIDAFNRMEAELRAPAEPVPSLMSRRWLVSFDAAGREVVQPVPQDATVATVGQVLKAITEPNGIHVETQALADFVVSAIQQLARRANARAQPPRPAMPRSGSR